MTSLIPTFYPAIIINTMKDQKMLRRLFPYLKRPDVEIFLDCASFIVKKIQLLLVRERLGWHRGLIGTAGVRDQASVTIDGVRYAL